MCVPGTSLPGKSLPPDPTPPTTKVPVTTKPAVGTNPDLSLPTASTSEPPARLLGTPAVAGTARQGAPLRSCSLAALLPCPAMSCRARPRPRPRACAPPRGVLWPPLLSPPLLSSLLSPAPSEGRGRPCQAAQTGACMHAWRARWHHITSHRAMPAVTERDVPGQPGCAPAAHQCCALLPPHTTPLLPPPPCTATALQNARRGRATCTTKRSTPRAPAAARTAASASGCASAPSSASATVRCPGGLPCLTAHTTWGRCRASHM